MVRRNFQLLGIVVFVVALTWVPGVPARGDTILDFSDVPPGTLAVFNPYTSQGFMLTSTSRQKRSPTGDRFCLGHVFYAAKGRPVKVQANGLANTSLKYFMN